MRVAIVEDEAVVARRLERMVRTITGAEAIDVVSEFGAALDLVRGRAPDLLFLDLNVNGDDGFRLLEEAAASRFQTIVVSAHHDQALRAFDYGVADFVAKPWSEERLRLAVDRASGRATAGRRAATLVVRRGRELRRVPVSSVLFARGADDYSELHLDDRTVHLHEKTLTALEVTLGGDFARVHRSYLVNAARVRGVRSDGVVLDDSSIVPIGRVYRARVRERFGVR